MFGNDDLLEYKIPPKIKSKIPDYFYYALGGECVSIFGRDVLTRDADGFCGLDYQAGTSGYAEAMKAACRKLDMGWLSDYREALPWYLSDLFDDEIMNEVVLRFDKEDHANAYYLYLLGKN